MASSSNGSSPSPDLGNAVVEPEALMVFVDAAHEAR
jgi:hypothetical protein